MQKQSLTMLGFVMLAGVVTMPLAHASDMLCEDKTADVQEQLEYAREHGNQHRIDGLQRALDAIEAQCTNEGVLDDAAKDVRESQKEVQERQADLEEALSEGDAGDIETRRAKLEDATRELEADTNALNTLQNRLAE